MVLDQNLLEARLLIHLFQSIILETSIQRKVNL
jgi:hypothetical protein